MSEETYKEWSKRQREAIESLPNGFVDELFLETVWEAQQEMRDNKEILQ